MRLLIVCITCLFAVACGNSASQSTPSSSNSSGSDFQIGPAESPDITIQLDGYNAGGTAKLIGTFQGQNFLADSTTISSSGNIHFKRNEPYNQGLLFLVLPNNFNLQLLVSEDQTFSMKTSINDPLNAMQIEGSLDNDLLYQTFRFEETQRPLFNDISAKMKSFAVGSPEHQKLRTEQEALVDKRKEFLDGIFSKYPNSLFTSFKSAGQNPDIRNAYNPDGTFDGEKYTYEFRNKFWEGVNFNDPRLMYTPVISNKLQRYINELTPQNPDSIAKYAFKLVDQVLDKPEYFKYFANWITLNYEPGKTKLMDAEAVYVYMVQKYFTYDRAFWSDSVETYALQQRAYEMAASLVGKKGPDVKAPGPDGKLKSIYDIKAPYIIVYMYNPDCEHCAEETPKLVEFYNEWKPKGVEVYGIAVDTEDAEWKAYIKKQGMTWTNVFDPTNKSIYAKYYVNITPEIYVLNPDRTIIAKNLKVHQIAEMIERDMRKQG